MNHFHYQADTLHCEEVAISDIAAQVGTPFYLYSAATLSQHFSAFDRAFAGVEHLTCFAVKSCSNLAILRLFAKLGGGADIVSGGELFRALRAGVEPGRIVYSGVGKSEREIREALQAGILLFNVESIQEMAKIQAVAAELATKARISFRVNPDVDPKTHSYISTGLAKNKFGIPIEDAVQIYLSARELPNLEIVGVSCHIGSQLTEVAPFIESLGKLKKFIGRLREHGIEIRYLDLGGGLGIRYHDETPPEPAAYGEAIRRELGDLACTLILEPGRVIVGNAGILVTKVLYTKNGKKKFIVVDAAMNDLARPSLYDAHHGVTAVRRTEGGEEVADVVGPICESGDFLSRGKPVPKAEPGDLLALMSAGAYGFSMSSNYNSRPRVAEVLAHGREFQVIRQRETYEDLIRGEEIPDFLR